MRLRAKLYVPRIVKRWLPTSLFGRSLLIIVLPVAVMQIAVTWAFFDAHWQTVNSRLSEGLAGDVALVVQSYQDDPSPAAVQKLSDRAEQSLALSIAFQKGKKLPTNQRPSLFAVLDRSLQEALSDRLDAPFWFDTTRYTAYIDIRVQMDGGVLQIYALRDRAFATQGHIFIVWMVVATLLLTGVAILFIRNQVRAIERLADAADAFGRGADPDFKPHGAREVRQAALAFMAMKARIQRHIEQRTALLASVSHDLRTPLTRLKLEMAMSEPSEQLEAMKGDLSEMEHMIDEYLAFARGEGGEALQGVDLSELVEGVVADAARGGAAKVETDIAPGLEANLRPLAFRRALANLIDNGVAHADRVKVTVAARLTGGVEVAVDDDGPGIPEDRYEEAFKPFSRLDESRNQNEKGVGLGLAIARDMARGLGGDLVLSRSAMGGLRAAIRLPG